MEVKSYRKKYGDGGRERLQGYKVINGGKGPSRRETKREEFEEENLRRLDDMTRDLRINGKGQVKKRKVKPLKA